MRKFHKLIFDEAKKGFQVVKNAQLGPFQFTYTSLFECQSLTDPIPAEVRLEVEGEHPSDYLITSIQIPICSTRLLEILQNRGDEHLQVFPAPTYRAGTDELIEGYHIVNPLQKFPCLESDRVVRTKKIPPEAHIFRPRESMFELIISDELAQDMVGENLEGVALVRLKSKS